MKTNPQLHVMVNGGYFDLATPYYEGWYEMHHLPIPDQLQKNIEYHYYPSGHMVYAHEESLKQLEGIVAQLERGDLPLEDSIKMFEEGMRLSAQCKQELDNAENKVQILLKQRDGSLKPEPFPLK